MLLVSCAVVQTDQIITDAYDPLISERRQVSLDGSTDTCFSSYQRIYQEVAHILPLVVNPTAVKGRVHFTSHGWPHSQVKEQTTISLVLGDFFHIRINKNSPNTLPNA